MTQLEFEWGTPIVIVGRHKPGWLMNEVYQFRLLGHPAVDWRLHEVEEREPHWGFVESIRLPASHAIYDRENRTLIPGKEPPKMIDDGPDPLTLGPNDPPGWAVVRAWNEVGGLVTPRSAILALARYIERHEKPPVDPDVVAVRAILAAAYEADDAPDRDVKGYRSGFYDTDRTMLAALEVYRTIKANGGVPNVSSS